MATSSFVGRRKYNVVREAVRAAVGLSHSTDGNWHFMPMKSIIRRIQCDIFAQRLQFAGWECEDLPFNLRDCLRHFRLVDPPIRVEIQSAKKIKNVPVFTPHKAWEDDIVPITSFLDQQTEYHSVADMLDAYKSAEQRHKDDEDHHPDGIGFISTTRKSFEVVFDVYNSLLRNMDVAPAYFKLLDILAGEKFANLSVKGVYSALLHFHVRGVSVGSTRVSSSWRKKTLKEAEKAHVTAMRGKMDINDITGYYCETVNHVRALESELIRLRIGSRHDRTKFENRNFHVYAWKWGIWECFTEQEKYSLLNRGTTPYFGRETMFSLGQTLGDGIAESRAPEVIENAIRDGISESLPEVSQVIRDEARQVIHETQQLLDERIERIEGAAEANVSRMEGLVSRLSGSLDAVMSSFDSVRSYISGSFQKVKDAILSIPGMADVNISLESLMMCLRDYILYVHVDSAVIKTLLVISMFRNLGFLDVGYRYFTLICSYFQSPTVGCETTNPFSFLSGSVENLIKVLAGVFASIASGTVLSASKFWDLVKALSSKLKEIHFIGAGCLGFTRIFDFIGKIYHSVAEWIKVNIFRQEPEKEKLAKKITCWVIKVKYFATEAGLAAIRANQHFRQTAEKLYPEYLELVAHTRANDEFKNLLIDLERHKREIKDIYDYITRLEAISSFCPTMFHAQFVGAAGIGKSTLMKAFTRDITNALWKGEKPSLYSYNPNLEYFDNYAGQRIFYIDDCFRYQEPKHLTTLVGLVTNTPVILPMANLSDKGTQLTSEVMLSTTNTAWPVGKDVLCMNAVHRRRHMLVETVADSRVLDPSTGAFCMSRYRKHYKEEDLPKMPHLKFNLLRPVPQDESDPNIQHTSEEQFDLLQEYAEKLKNANVQIQTPGVGSMDPTFYFSDENRPPEPWNLPCRDWTYHELVHNFVVRFRQFRDLERTYTTQAKFAHSEICVRELEALFNQQEDIPEGETFPVADGNRPFALIEKWFSYINRPYGYTDEVGQAILNAGESTIHPELNSVDLDGVVESLVTGSGETSDVDTISRLSRLIARRIASNRADTPSHRPYNLHVARKQVEQPDGSKKEISLIPLINNSTRWDGYKSFTDFSVGGSLEQNPPVRAKGWNMLNSYWEIDGMDRFITSMGNELNPGNRLSQLQWLKIMLDVKSELFKMLFSASSYYPVNDHFTADLAGKKSPFPLYFLQHLRKFGGEWYLDVTNMDFSRNPNVLITKRASVRKGDCEDTVPIDIAFVMSLMDTFRIFIADFDNLTPAQQDSVVADAKWRNQYTGLFTLEHIRETCTGFFKKLTIRSMEFILSPLNFVFNRMPGILMVVGRIAAFVGAIWMLRTLAGLIFGNEKETSKYLHRGPQSGIIYQGKLTAQRDEEFYDALMARNIRRVVLTDVVGRKLEVQAIHDKNFVIIPKHAILGLADAGDITVSVGIPGSEDFNIYKVPRKNFIVSKTSDVCVFTHREFGQTRDATRFFMTEDEFDNTEFSGHFGFLGRFKNNAMIEVHPYLRRVIRPTIRIQSGEEATIDRALIVKGQTTTGRSGSAVAFATPQSALKIVGIQVWSLGTAFSPEIAVQVLTQEMIRDLENKAEEACDDLVKRLAEPELPSPVRLEGVFTSAEVNQVVGEVPSNQMLGKVFKSQFKTTPIASYMDLDNFGSKRCPAALSPHDSRLQHPDHPLKHSVGKYSRGTVGVPFTPELQLAKDGLRLWIEEALDTDEFPELDYFQIVTGTRNDGSSPMNLNSSPGIPFVHSKVQKGKRDFFNINEEGVVDYFDPAIRTEFEYFYDVLKTRRVPLTYAYDFPKDELRPIEKVCGSADTPPKTRSVTCMNMFYLMAWRKNTLRFWDSMHRAADGTFPFCPGINPEGPEWSSAYHYLNKHPNVADFDVSNWDGHFPPWLFFDLVDVMAEVMNLDEPRRNILLSIAFEVTNSYIQYGRTVYQKFRGMLSGFPGTAEKNTLGHWLLAIYFWFRIVRSTNFGEGGDFQRYNTLAAFRANVSLLIYGDDIILSFSDDVREWFNGETLQREYQALGYPVTDGSKSLVVRKWKTLAEATFLKSTWRSCFYHVYIRKMDMSVAYDLLYWVRAKNEPHEQFCTNVIDALRIAFGHGKDEYNSFVHRLQRWLKKADIVLPLYSYREIMVDYIARYYGIDYEDSNLYNYS